MVVCMEGVSSEAASLAGHLKLSNLCWIYDNNKITIEGNTTWAFSEDVATRFLGYGWNVLRVGDANDLETLERAFNTFKNTTDRPTLIIVDSHIAYGALNKQDTHAAHGEPLGEEEIKLTKRNYGWPEEAKFWVPEEVLAHFQQGIGRRSQALREAWFDKFEAYKARYPELADQLYKMQTRRLPDGWDKNWPTFPADEKGLALDDIQKAADLLRPLYDESGGDDGYVSLEVSPTLAADTEGTIADAKRLFAALDRPNVMIKIPATPAGIPAIESVISAGINVTLIFSLSHYEAVAEAYLTGLEKLAASGSNEGSEVSRVASVASFFISRVDSAVDADLEKVGNTDLLGKIAVDNAKVAYARFRQLFSGERWQALAEKGARVQRPLWASTGAKNPSYPDTLYVDSLIGPDMVNTLPPATLQAFMDHGQVAATIEPDVGDARARLAKLAQLDIDLEAITQKLQDDGVAAFAQAFESLMASIAGKREKLLAEWQPLSVSLGSYQAAVDNALAELEVIL